MTDTLVCMPKKPPTEQVRIPVSLAEDGRIVASALGMSWPEYATKILGDAVHKDMAKAARITAKKAGRPTEEAE